MVTILLRLKLNQYDIIKAGAKYEGINVKAYMHQAILNRAQDSIDYRDAAKVEKNDHGKTISRASVMKKLGINKND